MQFYSTNNIKNRVSLKEAVLNSLPTDNGLYMPESIPPLSDSFLSNLENASLQEIAYEVSIRFLNPDISDEEVVSIVKEAINFKAPVVNVDNSTSILELFHGPTLAFKDFGARFMARLMSELNKLSNQEITILVATSGDTGSAVAHGFLGVEGIKVVILYPSGKVSEIQEKQLTTMGGNIAALEVNGVFDDCQKLVKDAFLDKDLSQKLNLTSANSINIARLLPQSFYYFYGVGQLLSNKLPIIVSVPSGNYGNLTAGLIAKRMGLAINRFVAASNSNSVVPDYLSSGVFTPRPSIKTISNAMDVGNPSNFSRILNLYNSDHKLISEDIWGISIDDHDTRMTIKNVFEEFNYILDPHGAVGYVALEKYRQIDKAPNAGLVLETAHPAKFPDEVLPVVGKALETPERLAAYLKREKVAERISSDFDEFKSFLLS